MRNWRIRFRQVMKNVLLSLCKIILKRFTDKGKINFPYTLESKMTFFVAGSVHHGERGPPSSPEAVGRLPGLGVDARHPAHAPRVPPRLRPEQQGQDRIQTPPQILLADRQSTCSLKSLELFFLSILTTFNKLISAFTDRVKPPVTDNLRICHGSNHLLQRFKSVL